MRCPFCPKKYQSEKDLHRHMKKIHKCDLTNEQLESINKEITIGDMCNWDEDEHTRKLKGEGNETRL